MESEYDEEFQDFDEGTEEYRDYFNKIATNQLSPMKITNIVVGAKAKLNSYGLDGESIINGSYPKINLTQTEATDESIFEKNAEWRMIKDEKINGLRSGN